MPRDPLVIPNDPFVIPSEPFVIDSLEASVAFMNRTLFRSPTTRDRDVVTFPKEPFVCAIPLCTLFNRALSVGNDLTTKRAKVGCDFAVAYISRHTASFSAPDSTASSMPYSIHPPATASTFSLPVLIP